MGLDNKNNVFLVLIGKIDFWLSRMESFTLSIGVMILALNSVTNVILRYVFDYNIHVTEEINRIAIVIIVFAGITYAARNGRHIRMSAFYDLLPFPWKKALSVVMSMITGVLLLLLSYLSVEYITSIAKTARVLPGLGIPVYIIYLWAPFGFFFCAVQYFLVVIKNMTERDKVFESPTLFQKRRSSEDSDASQEKIEAGKS